MNSLTTKFIAVSLLLVGVVFAIQYEEMPVDKLSGLYCNTQSVGEMSICLCYEFSEAGDIKMIYGSTVGTAFSASGKYTLTDGIISVNIKTDEGKELIEDMNLLSANRMKTNDGLRYSKEKVLPLMCEA